MADGPPYGVAIIGAGVLGCMLARELARYRLAVCVLEREGDVGEGSTKANSGIIHAGFQPRGKSLKGLSCVEGNALFPSIVEDLQIPYVHTGGIFVAFGREGLAKLDEKRIRAAQNGAGDLRLVSGDEARVLEPRLSPAAIAAVLAPTTGVISPFELVLSCARNAEANGVRFLFDAHVEAIERDRRHGGWTLRTADGRRFGASYVVNTAGGQAALLDALVRPADVVVRPRRGQYLVFDKQHEGGTGCGCSIKHVLYQAAESDEGGTLVAPTAEGNLLIGPTSENVRDFHTNATTEEGFEHVRSVARKLVPDLDFGRVIAGFAGSRANIANIEKERKDFILRASAPRFISALGIKNPGMTSAPSLAKRTVGLLEAEGLRLEPAPAFDPRAQPGHRVAFLRADDRTQRRLLAEDACYGQVVCRCEKVTEGDVRAVMREPFPPHTLDGVKRRLRCGMGRCQGGFCTPRIVSIMADELACDESAILKSEAGGHPVMGRVK